jgi:hypothetical protein
MTEDPKHKRSLRAPVGAKVTNKSGTEGRYK